MVRIRFRRVGSRNQATFRIVAADKESPRDGRFLEILGHYNPRTEPATVVVDEARLFHWLKNGAQPSESVAQALKSVGTWSRWERFKAGEELEVLLKEAAAEAEATDIDPRTRRDDLKKDRKTKSKKSKQAEQAAAEAEAEAPVEEAPVEEAAQAEEPESAVETPEAEAEEPEAETDEPEAATEEPEAPAAEAPAEDEVPAEDEPEAEPADAADEPPAESEAADEEAEA